MTRLIEDERVRVYALDVVDPLIDVHQLVKVLLEGELRNLSWPSNLQLLPKGLKTLLLPEDWMKQCRVSECP